MDKYIRLKESNVPVSNLLEYNLCFYRSLLLRISMAMRANFGLPQVKEEGRGEGEILFMHAIQREKEKGGGLRKKCVIESAAFGHETSKEGFLQKTCSKIPTLQHEKIRFFLF